MRVPGKTCHMSRFCWSGGLSESFCESGLCMCKWGYKVDATGNCVPNGQNPKQYPDPDAECEDPGNKDTTGTCSYFGCASSRNAQCDTVSGKCICAADKCANDGKCVPVPTPAPTPAPTPCSSDTGGTCAMFGCATSRSARCEHGKCVCGYGSCAQGGRCVANAFGTNATYTDEMTLAEMTEIWKQDDWNIMVNKAVFATWVGAAMVVLVACAFFLRRKLRSSDDGSLEYNLIEDGSHE